MKFPTLAIALAVLSCVALMANAGKKFSDWNISGTHCYYITSLELIKNIVDVLSSLINLTRKRELVRI